jgi:DNA-binding CsgD family transcriptional regulator
MRTFNDSQIHIEFDPDRNLVDTGADNNPSLRQHANLTKQTENQQFNLLFGNCLIDPSHKQFACIQGECQEHLDCSDRDLTNGSLDFKCLHFHPDDWLQLSEEIFPDILKFLINIPIVDIEDYRFSFNHRFVRKDESVSQFLLEGLISVSENRTKPVLNLDVFTETGDIKSGDSMILTIFRYDTELGYQKVFSKVYSKKFDSSLSQRELEIIRLCLDGLSSKMIADKLNLSIHTVKNHKRNCMEKTSTRNIAELIHICIQCQWL